MDEYDIHSSEYKWIDMNDKFSKTIYNFYQLLATQGLNQQGIFVNKWSCLTRRIV